MGKTLAHRFRIEREVGRGALGVVYLACDLQQPGPVAVKVLGGNRDVLAQDEQRLLHEAQLLATLQHPGVVRVLDAGRCPEHGDTYLAMEWLQGEDLAMRQSHQPLNLLQALHTAAQICDALAAAHTVGIVHRDIKPANVFLCSDGQQAASAPPRVKLLDFGVALRPSTQDSDTLAGTPAYMAPEQVHGEHEITPRSDLYALGALLFELLAGRPPHQGVTRVATLARMATTRAPRLSDVRRDVPGPVDDLVARLLDLDPAQRPEGAAHVARTLRDLLAHSGQLQAGADDPAVSARLGSSVSRLVTSLVALDLQGDLAQTQALGALRAAGAEAVALGKDAVVAHFGAERSRGTEAQGAVAAAQRLALSGARLGVASGRARLQRSLPTDKALPVGEVVDRASALARDAAAGSVVVDASTSELCRGRYAFRARDDGSAILSAALQGAQTARGAPFVGRESELAQVLGACERSRSERSAVLVTLTGLPGIGKTRLRREALARIAALPGHGRIVVQRSDSYGQRRPLGAVADVMRSLLGVSRGDARERVQAALQQQLGQPTVHEPTNEGRALLLRLLGDEELAHSDRSEATRDLLWLSLTHLVLHTGQLTPTLLVLEDLQWADPESVAFFDHLLGQAANIPLAAIVTLRPEFWRFHPDRFTGRDHARVELGPISARSTRALAQALLGEGASDSALTSIVQRSAGSPLFAEELARLVASGRDATRAPTIEAAIQASLDALPEMGRDALGRFSVFGLTGWDTGLAALGVLHAREALRDLAAAELLTAQDSSRFAGASEWSFKHALVRDVAYGQLGESERQSLHALAASWLANAGEDAAVVADHFDLGGQQQAAAAYWERAAQRALGANALKDALEMSERALAFAHDEKSGFLRARLLDEAWSRLDAKAADRESAVCALEDNIHDAVSGVYACGARVRYDHARGAASDVAERLASVRDEAARLQLHDEEARCTAALASCLAFAGDLPGAEVQANRLLELSQAGGLLSAAVDAWQTLAITRQTQGAVGAALDARRHAIDAAHTAGLRERESILTCNLGFALNTIGARQEARALLEQGLALAEALGSQGAARHARMNLLGWAASFGNDRKLDGVLSALRADADSAASSLWTSPDRGNLGVLYYRGCELLLFGGNAGLERAQKLLRLACDGYRATQNHDVLPVALGMRALGELKTGNAPAALTLALEAADLLESGAPSLLNESLVYVVAHDAQTTLGQNEAAERSIARGMAPLLRRVWSLQNTPYARMFLTELAFNSTLVSRAEQLGLLPDAVAAVLEQGVS